MTKVVEFKAKFMVKVDKVNEQIEAMKQEIYDIHEVNTSKSILKSSISEY